MRCASLKAIDLSPLSKVTVLRYFLCHCKGLSTVDLTPFTRLVAMPDGIHDGLSESVTIVPPLHLKDSYVSHVQKEIEDEIMDDLW